MAVLVILFLTEVELFVCDTMFVLRLCVMMMRFVVVRVVANHFHARAVLEAIAAKFQ